MADETTAPASRDFVRDIVESDLAAKRVAGVVTRFQP